MQVEVRGATDEKTENCAVAISVYLLYVYNILYIMCLYTVCSRKSLILRQRKCISIYYFNIPLPFSERQRQTDITAWQQIHIIRYTYSQTRYRGLYYHNNINLCNSLLFYISSSCANVWPISRFNQYILTIYRSDASIKSAYIPPKLNPCLFCIMKYIVTIIIFVVPIHYANKYDVRSCSACFNRLNTSIL